MWDRSSGACFSEPRASAGFDAKGGFDNSVNRLKFCWCLVDIATEAVMVFAAAFVARGVEN